MPEDSIDHIVDYLRCQSGVGNNSNNSSYETVTEKINKYPV